jgi:CRISPR-associated protein Cas5h
MAVVFDIKGRMGMFRKGWTTTSAVSFPVPPPTAVGGLLCAILGIDSCSSRQAHQAAWWEHLRGSRIATRILSPLAWQQHSVNFINSKRDLSVHSQIKHQMLSNPCYRIYVSGALEEPLKKILEKGEYVYTPYLGQAWALGEIRWHGSFSEEPVPPGDIEIHTLLAPRDIPLEIDYLGTRGVFREALPFRMDEERQIIETLDVLYTDHPSKPLRGKLLEQTPRICRCDNHVAAWFPLW